MKWVIFGPTAKLHLKENGQYTLFGVQKTSNLQLVFYIFSFICMYSVAQRFW